MSVISPRDMLKCAVVRQFAMMVQWADEEYLAPILELAGYEIEGSWTMKCIEYHNEMTRARGHDAEAVTTFQDLIDLYRKGMSKKTVENMVKKFQKHKLHVQKEAWKIQKDAQQQRRQSKPQTEAQYECTMCSMVFVSKTARAVHQRHKHHRFAEAAHFAPGTTCFACARQYFTRSRLVQHLQYGPTRCLEKIRNMIHPMSAQQVEDLCRLENEKIRRARQSGRRTGEQKRTFVQDGFQEVEDIFGRWNDDLSVIDFTREENEEREQLTQWELDNDLISLCEELQDTENQEILHKMLLEKGETMTGRVLVWWLSTLERSIYNLQDDEAMMAIATGIFVRLRGTLVDPAFDSGRNGGGRYYCRDSKNPFA